MLKDMLPMSLISESIPDTTRWQLIDSHNLFGHSIHYRNQGNGKCVEVRVWITGFPLRKTKTLEVAQVGLIKIKASVRPWFDNKLKVIGYIECCNLILKIFRLFACLDQIVKLVPCGNLA